MSKKYEADDVQVLDDIEHIRLRPGRVVGGANEVGLYIILKEILDNAFDEALAGHASKVILTLDDDRKGATVFDDGRGIPLDKNPVTKLTTLATVFGTSRTGAKFKNNAYGTSVGTHGEGSTATNALSEKFEAWTFRGRQQGHVVFKRGKIVGKDATVEKNDSGIKHGTRVHIRPDFEQIFKDVAPYDADILKSRLEDTALLLPNIEIGFKGSSKEDLQIFDNSLGLQGMLLKYAAAPLMFDPIVKTVEFDVPDRNNQSADSTATVKGIVEFALGWKKKQDGQPVFKSYVNLSHNKDGGTHQSGFEKAIANFFVNRVNGKCSAREILEGLVGVIHLKYPYPEFSSQTKERLINKELPKLVQEAVEPAIKSWVRTHAAEVDAWLAECVELYNYRQKEKDDRTALKDLKSGQRKKGIMPTKLYEANCRADQRELFICEGDSAAGSLADGRNASYQEVLPLRGKILNVLRASLAECLENKEIAAIIAAIGGGVGDDFDLSKCRISKLLIVCDADHDGDHISALVITLLAKFMPALLKAGRVYVVNAPLFVAAPPDSQRRYYGNTLEELKKKAGKEFAKCVVTRLKGHGQANVNEVAEYALNPDTRSLTQIKFTDEDFKQISLLMSEEVEARKELLGV